MLLFTFAVCFCRHRRHRPLRVAAGVKVGRVLFALLRPSSRRGGGGGGVVTSIKRIESSQEQVVAAS